MFKKTFVFYTIVWSKLEILSLQISDTHSIMKKNSQHCCEHCKTNKGQYNRQSEDNSVGCGQQQKQNSTRDAKASELEHAKKIPPIQTCQCNTNSNDKHVKKREDSSRPSLKDKVCLNGESWQHTHKIIFPYYKRIHICWIQ